MITPPKVGHTKLCTIDSSLLQLKSQPDGVVEVSRAGFRLDEPTEWYFPVDRSLWELGIVQPDQSCLDGWAVHQTVRSTYELVAVCVTFEMAVMVLSKHGKYASLHRPKPAPKTWQSL